MKEWMLNFLVGALVGSVITFIWIGFRQFCSQVKERKKREREEKEQGEM